MVQLRSFVFIDSLQPQLASFVASAAKGFMPVAGMASLYVEVAPGMEIIKALDVALKATTCRPAVQVVERAYGCLEVHSDDKGQVLNAGKAILDYLGLKEEDRLKPKVVSSSIIRRISPYQSQLINKGRDGSMLLGDQTLYTMETDPAAYVTIAANEAEKASHVTLVEVRPVGRFGRLYLGGEERDIMVGSEAATRAIEAISGKEQAGKGGE
ncbi:MAG: hypothetical protein IT574_09770 [Candidatus Aureabacteria bacterium]|jgi:hypothetical protein|nr:hypothetical protein [Candidatus Auribacterota bacterium]NLW94279.1 hypothetical protein [Chlamydiota bacterium]HQM52062.1 hypothetical protein [bacterium]